MVNDVNQGKLGRVMRVLANQKQNEKWRDIPGLLPLEDHRSLIDKYDVFAS